MADFVLFGTEGCHLCEEAEQLISQAGLTFDKRDIIDNEQLQQHYAIRIPVLLHSPSNSELGWPFNTAVLLEFAEQTSVKKT